MRKVSNIISLFRKELAPTFNDREVVNWAYLCIENLLGYNRSEFIINQNQIIDADTLDKLFLIINKLKIDMPIQYILGKTNFYGLDFKINKNCLIPRPETEGLVSWILKEEFSTVVDIGTGSGCIAICLAKNSNAIVSGIDVCKNVLKLAKINSISNDVDVLFYEKDIFQVEYLSKGDIIVSNPPYVLNSEKKYMRPNVLNYEPELAVFVPNETPLIFYDKIIAIASKSLNKGGKLFFEINERFSKEIFNTLVSYGFVDIRLKKDINDKDRMIKAIWK